MRKRIPSFALLASTFLLSNIDEAEAGDWQFWRGPLGTGTSLESYEKGTFNPTPVWTKSDAFGRGTPIIIDGKLYAYAYRRGDSPTVRETNKLYDYLPEILLCLDPATGEKIWEVDFPEYISDTVYDRYGIGSPGYDPETGNLYLLTANGHFACISKDGKILWEVPMVEEFGSLTFPNGRTGCPIIEGDLVIVRRITANWGAQGPGADRFYAFDKHSGKHVWASEPGVRPQDSSFSTPFIETRNGQRIMYVGTGCGNLAAINMLTGQPLWRYQMSHGGVNSSPLLWKDRIIAIHGRENLDSSEEGRMVAIRIPSKVVGMNDPQVVLTKEDEIWRLPINSFSSSPVLLNDLIYQVTKTGSLVCVEPGEGKILWEEKLGTDNLGHASPLAVNGLLIVPMLDGNVYVINPTAEKAEILHTLDLDGACNGAPAVADGRVFIETTEKIYCFAFDTGKITYGDAPNEEPLKPGAPVALQAVPSEVILHPGGMEQIKLYSIDANGVRIGEVPTAQWAKFVPPTAKVQSEMDADFRAGMVIEAKPDAKESAGAFKATTADNLSCIVRGRVLRDVPFSEDFESYKLVVDHPTETGVKFAHPALPWSGARFKWEIREIDGNKVLAKTLDRVLFQRAITFIGHADSSNYTIEADMMTDGNRRIKSTVGLINQRYVATLVGNKDLLEVASNHERFKVAMPFPVTAGKWYTMKMRVDVDSSDNGIIKVKAWAKGTAEPESWTLEVPHMDANKVGAPGLFGYSPQAQKSVYIDNIKVTPNE
ncbi:MAG: PQQ-binding-like beta-propeller repeat protein [Verrucomicrobia bacterium]|nr:PQQ-binding-like beta-propeller repeat protein [Verrucomicrobiota bacterium]